MPPSSASHIFSDSVPLKAVLGPRLYFFCPALHYDPLSSYPGHRFCIFTFTITHIFCRFSSCGKFSSWWASHCYKASNDNYNPIKDSCYTSALYSANHRMGSNGKNKDLPADLVLKSALVQAGGWTSWAPDNLNYCMVPNIFFSFSPKNLLKRRVRLPKDVWSISSSSPSGFLCFILSPKESALESTAGVLGFIPKELMKYQVSVSLKLLGFFFLL